MGELSQASLMGILKPLTTDEEFVKSLVKFMMKNFDILPPDLKIDNQMVNLINRIEEHYGICTRERGIEIPGFRDTLIGMLRDKRFYAFARVLRMLRDLFGYSEDRLVNYLKKVKFQTIFTGESITPWIDIRKTAEAIREELNPSQWEVLSELTDDEKYLLQGLTSEQIDLMSKFSATGIVILSGISRLRAIDRKMMLRLQLTEGWLFKDIGFRKIRLLAVLDVSEMKRFLGLGLAERQEMSVNPTKRSNFLRRYSLDIPERQDLLQTLVMQDTEDLRKLEDLITRERVMIQSMGEAVGALGEQISSLTAKEREKYLHLTGKQMEVLFSLNDDYRSTVMRFANYKEALNVANSLSSAQRDVILSLRKEEIDALFENGIAEEVELVLSHGAEIIQHFSQLSEEEEDAILKLNQRQRSILAKAYNIGRDGPLLIRKLGIGLTGGVLRGEENLTVMQRALKKKLHLDIFDTVDLPELFQIMEHGEKDVLLNLSWKGTKLLRRMAELDENMITIVERLSNDGMKVLIANDKLIGAEIVAMRELGDTVGKVVMNLNLDQREFLSNNLDPTDLPPNLFNRDQSAVLRTLNPEASRVLRRIVPLSDTEQRLLTGLKDFDTTALTTMNSVKLKLFATISTDELRLLSSFMVWHLEEDLAFKFLAMKTETPANERIERTRTYLNKISGDLSMEQQHNHFSMMAGTIETLRMNGIVKDDYVTTIPSLIEEFPGRASHSLIFRLYLLKFSMKDSKSLIEELLPGMIGTDDELSIIRRVDRIRTIEDLTFMKWILSQPPDMSDGTLFDLAHGNLIRLSYRSSNGYELGFLLSKTDETERQQIIENLRQMLMANEYSLATCLFFSIGDGVVSDQAKVQSMKLIKNVFQSGDYFNFLNTIVQQWYIRKLQTREYPDMLSNTEFLEPNIFDVSLYFNRGSVLALTENLENIQLWRLLNRRPVPLLTLMARNCQIRLIHLYRNVGGIDELINTNRRKIIGTLMEYLRHRVTDLSSEIFPNLSRMIRILAHWGSFIGQDVYNGMVSEYMNLLDGYVPVEVMRTVLNRFVSDRVNLEGLLQAVRHSLARETYSTLRDAAHEGCGNRRMRRNAGMKCLDSRNAKELTPEETERIMRETFDEKQFTLYNELLEYSKVRFRGRQVDPQLQQSLISKIKEFPSESFDPRIKDIVEQLRDPELFDSTLKRSGTVEKLEKVTSIGSTVFTFFMVGKHIAHGNAIGLAYDVLGVGVLPKLGECVTNLLEVHHPILGTAIGRTVSNFVAYLGLVQGIIARTNAVDEVDEEEADVNIVSSAGLIALDVAAVAKQILIGMEADVAIVGVLSGPIGMTLTAPIIIGTYLIDAALEMQKVTRSIQLSVWEREKLYVNMLLDQPIPERLQIDVAAQELYIKYISDQVKRYHDKYDNIAISLPRFFVTESECVAISGYGCNHGDKRKSIRMDFDHRVIARYPFAKSRQISRLISENIQGYDLICGPSAEDADEVIIHPSANNYSSDSEWSSQTRELFIPPNHGDDCVYMVSLRKHGAPVSSKMLFYVASTAASIELSDDNSLDIVFHGTDLMIDEHKIPRPNMNSIMNTFSFHKQLRNCKIRKKGHNWFYIKGGQFDCDLGDSVEQHNTVMIDGDFSDSRGIHSIVGTAARESIRADYAELVDGNGGGDIIRATGDTVVKGYPDDFISGNCTVILPFNISAIEKLVAHTRMNIYHRQGSWITVDSNNRLITADNFLLTPMRISNKTHRMIHASIRKTVGEGIDLQEELTFLRNLTIPGCTLVKQMTSANYDIVLSDTGRNVFNMDHNNLEYYWEGAKEPGNLYIIRKLFANVTISNASGIIDLKELTRLSDGKPYQRVWSPEGGFDITIGNLRVSLLANYGNVKITFDGQTFQILGRSELSTDWCSHSLPINGTVVIDGADLHGHYNCFEFQLDYILFLRIKDDLLLVSRKQLVTILEYYVHVYGALGVSLKSTDGEIMEAPVFSERARSPHKLIHYDVGSEGMLEIYHNQPVDEHHIGFVDLKDRSIKDFHMTIERGGLFLSYLNSTAVRIENWDNYEPARDVMFAFEDGFIPNAGCVLENCNPYDVIEEFGIQKSRSSVTSDASRGSSWINGLINAFVDPLKNYWFDGPTQFSSGFCINSNVNLIVVLLQNFIDRRFPISKPRTIPMVENLTNIINLIEEYGGDENSFQLYSDIVELARNERYHSVSKKLKLFKSFETL